MEQDSDDSGRECCASADATLAAHAPHDAARAGDAVAGEQTHDSRRAASGRRTTAWPTSATMDTTAAADDEVRPDAPDMAAATKAHLSEAAATAAPAEAGEADSDENAERVADARVVAVKTAASGVAMPLEVGDETTGATPGYAAGAEDDGGDWIAVERKPRRSRKAAAEPPAAAAPSPASEGVTRADAPALAVSAAAEAPTEPGQAIMRRRAHERRCSSGSGSVRRRRGQEAQEEEGQGQDEGQGGASC